MTQKELEDLAYGLEMLRTRAFELCDRRRWSLGQDHRFKVHVKECAELDEALLGKRNTDSIVEEAGDVLITALTMIPPTFSFLKILRHNYEKVDRLMTALPYQGEDREGT